MERRPDLEVAVSATTRPRRRDEVEGRDYYFLAEPDFIDRAKHGDFLEHVVYVSGQRYGTLRSEIERILTAGRSCVLELETEGARTVKEALPESVTIFVATPSFAELERRLRARGKDTEEAIERRLAAARAEMAHAAEFDYVIINSDFDEARQDLAAVVRASRLTVARQRARYPELF